MNRNTEAHFSKLPNVKIERSLFDRSTQNKLSFNAGKLIPIFADEYLPGDTFTLDTSIILRTSSPFIKPVMDNMYADIYYFSVPNRLVWEHWKEFMGENTSGPWTQQTEYTIPQVQSPTNGWAIGTIADYFGMPTAPIAGYAYQTSALFFRAYALIWNQYFRDENLMNFTDFRTDDAITMGSNGGVLETDAIKGGQPLPVCKFHDYFTSALPGTQKGAEVKLNLSSDYVPVFGNGYALPLVDNPGDGQNYKSYKLVGGNGVYDYNTSSSTLSGDIGIIQGNNLTWQQKVTGFSTGGQYLINHDGSPYMLEQTYGKTLGLAGSSQLDRPESSGLVADVSSLNTTTINNLREAFALQRLLEKDARGGTRYIEMIKAHFNVNSPDARLQRPEYLGGKRIPINISQVVQMSGTESNSGTQQTPQANVAAYSLTADKSSSFTKSFTEHGMIIGLICVRTEHTYQQGLNKMFSRKRRYDFYFPTLAHLGEVPILNQEIYLNGTNTDQQTFGFQEVWAEYRYKPSMVCGEMRSNATNSLDVYHFADDYASKPVLGQSWIQETETNIDRTLAIPSTTSNQFIADIYFTYRCARPMPTYSIPGLMDHY